MTPEGKCTLVLTVGLPRCGKSTWARQRPWPVVASDEIRKAMGCFPLVAEREPEVWSTARVMVEALFGSGATHIILDATNITRRRRDAWRSPKWTRTFVVFPCDVPVSVARATDAGMDYLVPVITRMAEAYEPLDARELDAGDDVIPPELW